MKNIITLIVSLVIAIWIVAIAILSVQNATPVALKFLGYSSIQLPVGVVLAFCAGMGVMLGAIALPLLSPSNLQSDNLESDNDFDEDLQEDRKVQEERKVGANDWVESGSKDW